MWTVRNGVSGDIYTSMNFIYLSLACIKVLLPRFLNMAEYADSLDAKKCEEVEPTIGTGFKAFTSLDWQRIETICPNLRQVGMMMHAEANAMVSGKLSQTSRDLAFDLSRYCGLCEQFKLDTRASSVCENPFKPQHKNTKNGKQRKNGMKNIRDSNTRTQDVEKIIRLQSTCPRWEFAEVKPDAYIVAFRLWLNARGCKGDVRHEEKLDRLVSCKRLLPHIANHTLIALDVEDDMSKILCNFSFAVALETAARNECIMTAPTYVNSCAPLTLYEEQRDVASSVLLCARERLAILNGLEGPLPSLLLRFCTPPSTGKSSAAAYLGALHNAFMKEAYKSSTADVRKTLRSYIVYECYSESVRFDVAKMCVAASIPFAIVSDCLASISNSCYHQKRPHKKTQPPQDAQERLSYSMSALAACDNRPAVLICDPVSAIAFLSMHQDEQLTGMGDVLILDEPTTCISESVTTAHARILACSPAITILMSATCPEFSSFPHLVSHLQQRYGRLDLVSITSERISSPCTVVDARGQVYGPHRVFRGTCDELLQRLHKHIHLKRLYSPRAVLQLVNDIPPSESEVTAYIETRSAMDVLSTDSIRGMALKIISLCSSSLKLWCDISAQYVPPTPSLLCTTDAHLLQGVSFIISRDSDAMRHAALTPLSALGDKLDKRLHQRAVEQAQVSRSRCHEDSKHGHNERSDRLTRLRETDEMLATVAYTPIWPSRLCVNTLEHLKAFARTSLYDSKRSQQVPLVPDDVLTQSCEALVVGLLCGFNTLQSTRSDRNLTLTAQNLAENKSFSYLNGNRTSIFGVNLPCDRVVLFFDVDDVCVEEIVQSLGRCGRTGKFSTSEALFSSYHLLEYLFLAYESFDPNAPCGMDEHIAKFI